MIHVDDKFIITRGMSFVGNQWFYATFAVET